MAAKAEKGQCHTFKENTDCKTSVSLPGVMPKQGYPSSQDDAAVCLLNSLSDLTYKNIHGGNLSGAPKVVDLVKTYEMDIFDHQVESSLEKLFRS